MNYKIFIKNNYIIFIDEDGTYFSSPAKDVLVNKTNETSTDFFFKGMEKFNSTIPLANIKKENGDAYTEQEWEDFYTSKTGFSNGGAGSESGAFYSDWSKTATGTTPTTLTKIDFSGATLVNESKSLFDATNSRIIKMPLNTVGKVVLTMELNTSSGTNLWAETQLKAYDVNNNFLFSKRPCTASLVKNNSTDNLRQELEFYFGSGVDYFEIWYKTSTGLTYVDPAITVIRL